MQNKRAREILQSLVQGLDPFTGAPLGSDSVLQHAETLRALLAGIAAINANDLRDQRRAALPKNIGRTWSPEEQAQLIDAFQSGHSAAVIAERHGRTVRAIEARLEKLGLITAAERTTQDRFGAPDGES